MDDLEDTSRDERLDALLDENADGKVSIAEWEAVHGNFSLISATAHHRDVDDLPEGWVKVPKKDREDVKTQGDFINVHRAGLYEYVNVETAERRDTHPGLPPNTDESLPGEISSANVKSPKDAKTANMTQAESKRRFASISKLFAAFDKDGDQNLAFNEYLSLGRLLEGTEFDESKAKEVYNEMDRDKDGGVSEAEFGAYVFRQTKKIDHQKFERMMDAMISIANSPEA